MMRWFFFGLILLLNNYELILSYPPVNCPIKKDKLSYFIGHLHLQHIDYQTTSIVVKVQVGPPLKPLFLRGFLFFCSNTPIGFFFLQK